MPEFLTTLAFWIYMFVLTPYVTFVAFYAIRSPWRTTAAGRAIMILAVTLVAVICNGMITLVFGNDWPGRELARAFLLGLGAIAGWYLLITLLTIQDRGRRLLDTIKQEAEPPEHRDKRIRRARLKMLRLQAWDVEAKEHATGERDDRAQADLAEARDREREIQRKE